MLNNPKIDRELEKRVSNYLSNWDVQNLNYSRLDEFYADFSSYSLGIINEGEDKFQFGRKFVFRVLDSLPEDFRAILGRKSKEYLDEIMIKYKENKEKNEKPEDIVPMIISEYSMREVFAKCKSLAEDIDKIINKGVRN